ncbi:MAG TPA: Clp protease N-terminal domain-containing protein [Capsulimonadaceae bacterium]|jgi:ATP-dependent Clp protease ATP-binding subunit ClpA
MWQRFTERARKVIFYAQEEAGQLGENYVSTEHMLLGLIRENDTVAARILDRLGISLGKIRSEVERIVSRGDGRLGQDMQLTPRAKRVIDLAYDESRRLNNNYIGTEHLLLGMVRESEGVAGRVLAKLGADLERTRTAVYTLQTSGERGAAPPPSPYAGSLAFSKALVSATVKIVELRDKSRVSEIIIQALLAEEKSSAVDLLEAINVNVAALRQALKDSIGAATPGADDVADLQSAIDTILDVSQAKVTQIYPLSMGYKYLLLSAMENADPRLNSLLGEHGFTQLAVDELDHRTYLNQPATPIPAEFAASHSASPGSLLGWLRSWTNRMRRHG